jgi:hypothetical protein
VDDIFRQRSILKFAHGALCANRFGYIHTYLLSRWLSSGAAAPRIETTTFLFCSLFDGLDTARQTLAYSTIGSFFLLISFFLRSQLFFISVFPLYSVVNSYSEYNSFDG